MLTDDLPARGVYDRLTAREFEVMGWSLRASQQAHRLQAWGQWEDRPHPCQPHLREARDIRNRL